MPKELSAPIYELLCSLTQPPAELHKCRTIHEAVRVSRRLRWARKIHRLSAVSTWTTCTLVANDKCRKHLTRLITNEVDGERWVMQIASAVRPVMEELDRLDANQSTRTTKDRTLSFSQHRDAAVRALEKARTHLAAINCEPSIKELIDHPNYGLLQDAVADQEEAQVGKLPPRFGKDPQQQVVSLELKEPGHFADYEIALPKSPTTPGRRPERPTAGKG